MGVAIASSFQSGLGSPPTELLSAFQLKDTKSVYSGLCPALGSRGAALGYTQCGLTPERRRVPEAEITMGWQHRGTWRMDRGREGKKEEREKSGWPPLL